MKSPVLVNLMMIIQLRLFAPYKVIQQTALPLKAATVL